MRLVAIITLLFCAFAASSRAEIAIGTNLTVLLDFENRPHSKALDEMQSEVRGLLRRTGVRLDLRLRSETHPSADFEEVVLMRFQGTCKMGHMAPMIDERGPLAWSHSIEGEILPFGDVACDKIRRSVEDALYGGKKGQREKMFGRALGRVVAHELYHIIGSTHIHGKKGVAQAALSGRELIDDHMELEREDANRVLSRLHSKALARLDASKR